MCPICTSNITNYSHSFSVKKHARFEALNVLKGWTFVHTYGIINPFLHRNEMLTDEVNSYGLAIINIKRCFIERVSDSSRCNLNKNTRDSLPWFFFILFSSIYTHEGAGLIDFFFYSLGHPLNACRKQASSILRKEDRRVSNELTAHSHIQVFDYVKYKHQLAYIETKSGRGVVARF